MQHSLTLYPCSVTFTPSRRAAGMGFVSDPLGVNV